jgi:hypothetical protein
MEQTPHEHPKQHQTQVDAVSRNLEEWFAELEKKLSEKDIAYFKSLKGRRNSQMPSYSGQVDSQIIGN